MEQLPQPQQEVLDYLAGLSPDHPAPTIKELMAHFNMSQAAIDARLRGLKYAGHITWEPGKARSIRVLHPGCQWVAVPVEKLPLVEAVLDQPSPTAIAAVESWVSQYHRQRRVEAAAGYSGEAPL